MPAMERRRAGLVQRLRRFVAVATLCAAACAVAVLPALSAAASVPTKASNLDADGQFNFWVDYPGSQAYKERQPQWWDLLETRAGQSFTNADGVNVEVNWATKGAIHLFADPSLLGSFDDKIRAFSGPESSVLTGTVDRCGWPNTTAADTPAALQWRRRTTPVQVDFSQGLDSTEMVIGLQKGCCDRDKYAPQQYARNINVVKDVVNGVEKNVIALTAWNADNPTNCPGPKCRKDVTSSGTIASADLFASGRYEVIAKVPASPGLVFAAWLFHYEMHMPAQCERWVCYCENMPNTTVMVEDNCEFRADGSGKPCKYVNSCDGNTDGWNPQPPPPEPILSPYECGQLHLKQGADPQYLGNNSFAGWVTEVNHEIDIEIPANCEGTSNVCTEPGPENSETCIGKYNTANLNNYIYTQNSGTGPAYSNMCINATTAAGVPVNFMGDGNYHNYTIVWHTGSNTTMGRTEFYIDDMYLGTNNVFAPTRGSRFYIAHWGPTSKNPLWNGTPDTWGGGHAGDGLTFNSTMYISEVNITPFNEENDIMYPNLVDQPDGCTPNFMEKYASSPSTCHPTWTAYDIKPPAN